MTTRAPLDSFETALLSELRQHVVTRQPAPTKSRLRRRLVAGGAALGAAVAITAGGLALRPDAAFAVNPQADGDVVVTIHSLSDADGLESALRAQGVDADVDYSATPPDLPAPGTGGGTTENGLKGGDESTGGKVTHHEVGKGKPTAPAGCEGLSAAGTAGGVPTTSPDPDRSTVSVERTDDGVTFTLSKSFVDSDAEVHITTMGSDDGPAGIMVQVEQHC